MCIYILWKVKNEEGIREELGISFQLIVCRLAPFRELSFYNLLVQQVQI